MHFANIKLLNLLWLIPALIWFYYWARKKRQALLARFGEARLLSQLSASVSPRQRKIKKILLLTTVAFVVLALARPQSGGELREVHSSGADILVAVDVSLSMLAEDLKPNRLIAAQRKITDLINKLAGDRIGIIVFSGTSFMVLPLTNDYDAARLFLKLVKPEAIPVPGTDIAGAIKLANKSFKELDTLSQALVIITDGESLEGDPVKEAEELAKRGVSIYTIGMGKPEGEPIPLRDAQGKVAGYKKDKNGELVLSRLDEKTLNDIAQATGGRYFKATTYGAELEAIYNELSGLEKQEFKTRFKTVYHEDFQIFVLLALLLLMAEFITSERK